MIVRNPKPPIPYLATPSPDPSPRGSTIFSDCEADDEDTMSEEASSRPNSYGHEKEQQQQHPSSGSTTISPTNTNSNSPTGPYCPQVPTLVEILSNTAPPPWTLSAFTAHLHQNHCLENLEFIKDAERYRKRWEILAAELAGMPMTAEYPECAEVRNLWSRLLNAYIVPEGPREVNLPADVRDVLLSLPNHAAPPSPDALDRAVERIMELMNESIMMPFINEHSPAVMMTSQQQHGHGSSGMHPHVEVAGVEDSDERRTRSSLEAMRDRSRSRRKPSPHGGDIISNLQRGISIRHPQGPSSRSRLNVHNSNSSTGSGMDHMLTDDTASLSSPTDSPMTPPTTPPSSDMGGTSPRSKGDGNTWRKMMGRLSSKNKNKSSHRMDPMEE